MFTFYFTQVYWKRREKGQGQVGVDKSGRRERGRECSRECSRCAQEVLLVAAAEDIARQDPKGRPDRCLNTNT